MSLYLLIILPLLATCNAELSDYMQVYEKECLGEDKIHCSDGTCIWQHQYCDKKIDCPDGSDESLCFNETPERHECNETTHYLCRDQKQCIPSIWVCNNEADCLDGSDEGNCTDTPASNATSTCKGFVCDKNKRCISYLWVCDGAYDCDDRTDETPTACRHHEHKKHAWEACAYHISNALQPKFYQCLDGRCIGQEDMCNGIQDCTDGSDEWNFCSHWHTMCNPVNCGGNATCYPEREGPLCVCKFPHFYNTTSNTCEPHNYCSEARANCGQICEDRNGPFMCDCEEGYLKDFLLIGHICMAPDPEAWLFYSTGNAVKYMGLKSKKNVTIATGLKQAHGVAYDAARKNVYWVETAQGHQAIVKVNLENLGNKEAIVGLGLEDPGDIAIDWLGGNFYFSDAERGIITVCALAGYMCTNIGTIARLPKHLTLYVRNGTMFWADWHAKPVIMTAGMDGSNARVLTDELQGFPSGLVVDTVSGRLYFVDHVLKGVRIDNGEVFNVSRGSNSLHRPYALAVFENFIYWSDWSTNTIQTTDKLSGGRRSSVVAADSTIFGLSIYHPILERNELNPCENHTCSHFCLLAPNRTFSCACPPSLQLDNTTGTCLHNPNYRPKYVVVGSGRTLARLEYDALSGEGMRGINFDIDILQAMAYDAVGDTLYVYDAKWKTINYVKMSEFLRGSTRVLHYMGLDNVVDMDYDYVTGTLYFLDAGRKFIEVTSVETGKRAIIHRFENEIPISFCILHDYGKILVAVTESEQNNEIHIDVLGLDGSGREHVLIADLKGPHIRLKYSEKFDNVYLADEGNMAIEMMHPQGTGRETFRELSTSVTGLALTESLALWTSRRGARLYWADLYDTSRNIRRIELPQFSNTSHLYLQVASPITSVPIHPCQKQPCSDICVQTPKKNHHPRFSQFNGTVIGGGQPKLVPLYPANEKVGYKCLCPPGLLEVEGNCTELVVCKEMEAYCHNSNMCIFKNELCDGKKDCLHGEDEEGCNHFITTATCAKDETLCEDKCIKSNQVCGSSTTTSTEGGTIECLPMQFECVRDRVCIERSQMCDGIHDCSDRSDEAPSLCSTLNCLPTEYMCTSGHCILNAFRCDGEIDCTDGSDEFACNKTCSTNGYFQCRNLECIEVKRRCDQQTDCADNSDEEDCENPDLLDGIDEIEPDNCAAWEYTCEYNRSICIPISAKCNQKTDCPGGTDEENCVENCSHGGLPCDLEQYCISKKKICDGKRDCNDGSDETPRACAHVNKTSQLYPVFPSEELCREGYRCDSNQCIEWRYVCDLHEDCIDGSDEGGICSTACDHHNCSFACQRTPLGPLCTCPSGYELGVDHHTCQDLDECSKDVCSQHCVNTPGSFLCTCHRGYALRSDRRSCKAIKGSMSVLYVTGNSVRSITADGHINMEFNDSTIASVTDMDYDVRRGRLYVTSSGAGVLIEVNGTREKVVVTNIGKPTKVAVDWVTGNVYFVDNTPTAKRMRVCHVGRLKCAKLQKLPSGSEVTSVVIDPTSCRIFYCITRDLESVIWSSNLAGRHVTQVAVVANCTGLAADSFKKRLYVAETGPAHIVSMDYDGNFYKQVLTEHPHLQAPHDLAIFEDHIYFLVANSFKLSRCLLFGKKHCEIYLQRVFNANTFVIRHESTQRDDIPNFCDEEPCENVCVQGDMTGICLCADGSVSKNGQCSATDEKELPLFNGLTAQSYHWSPIGSIIGWCVGISLCLAFSLFVYKRYWQGGRVYGSLLSPGTARYRNEPDTERTSFASPAPDTDAGHNSSVTLDLSRSRREFVNPLQMLKNIRWPRDSRPVGTATLNVPSMASPATLPDILVTSDTESDLGEINDRRSTSPLVFSQKK